jgi:hypothetical protein
MADNIILLDEIYDLCAELNNDALKQEITNNKLREFLSSMKELKAIDVNVQRTILALGETREDSIYTVHDFPKHINTIDEDSIIFYIEKARLYKTYNTTEIRDKLSLDMRTVLAKPDRTGPVFEVVRDNFKQKIVFIMIDIHDNQINYIRDCILAFLRKYWKLNNLKNDDCIIFRHGNQIRYTFKGLTVADRGERQMVMEDFYRFLDDEGHTEVLTKLQLHPPPGRMAGAVLNPLPSTMTPVNRNPETHEQELEYLLTNLQKEGRPVQLINLHVVQNINGDHNNVSVMNNSNNANTKISINSKKKKTGDFYKEICDKKPTWYKENKYVEIDTIRDAYDEFFHTDSKSASVSRWVGKVMFSKRTRDNAGTVKYLLVPFSTLRQHFDDE